MKICKSRRKEKFPEIGREENELKQGNREGNSKFVVND